MAALDTINCTMGRDTLVLAAMLGRAWRTRQEQRRRPTPPGWRMCRWYAPNWAVSLARHLSVISPH
ncbi:DUF4113 domain-containing protein [Azospirillum brasilense]|uniref:DUF4113 domain-containing protein n=1 Tax=Azospirillum brasilense TaxID=192 RepID=A0A6L3ARX7_AZOBR|nr:DUF4113 domain-containing protein [Azospirillum brasilense]